MAIKHKRLLPSAINTLHVQAPANAGLMMPADAPFLRPEWQAGSILAVFGC
jgi:hypothetical protein